jgi:hypothetical protein
MEVTTMPNEEIEVTLDPNGEVHIKVRGMKGKKCLDATKALESALGLQVEKRTYTSEYYDTEIATQKSVAAQRTR